MTTTSCRCFWLQSVMFVGWVCMGGTVWAQKSGVDPTVLSLPSGPGSLGGIGENVQANLNMGLMSYPVRVVVPSGRGKATPNVSLTYSSSAGSGMMGIGWSLNAGGSVSRLTVRGLPTYTNSDRFYAGQELVKIPSSVFYRSRIEGGFARYKWIRTSENDQRGYWISENPDGSKEYFGANSQGDLDLDSQVYGLQGTYQWDLRTFVDRNGNRVEYKYFKDGTQNYIDTLEWVFDKNNKALYRAAFLYETRPDPISDGKPGFDLQTLKRLKEIVITSAGQRIRSYTFTFEDATGLSRLLQVTHYGRDGKTAYPVAFAMKYSDATFAPDKSRLVTMPTALGVDFANRKADFLDINGDGLPDVIDTSQSKHQFHINTLTLDDTMKQKAHDFSQKLTNPDATSGAELSNASVQMIDYNGDGFTDMVDAVNKVIYINKGNGRWEANSGTLTSFPVDGKDANMRFFDYNGDKAIDVISSNGTTTTYWVSDGKGNWQQIDGKPNLGVSVSQDKIRFIDINGDGLNDAVQILPKTMRYKKYLGYGNWSDWIEIKVPDLEKYDLNASVQFSDINGDGMADMVAFLGSSIVYFTNKNGKEFNPPQQIQEFGGQSVPNSTKNSVRIADMNGNGSRDIVWIDSNGKVTYLELFSERPNLLREISNGIGQRINVEYSSSVNFYLRDQSCAVGKDKSCEGPWQNKMPMAFTVVSRILTWASRSENPANQKNPVDAERPSIQEVYYHNGFYDGTEKQFRGFRKVESITLGDDSVQTRYDIMEYDVGDKDIYFHGKLLRTVAMDKDKGIYNQTTNEWKDCGTPAGTEPNLDPPVRFICSISTETVIQEKLTDTSQWKTTRSETTYDGFGNVILNANLGDKSKEGDELYTHHTYITPKEPKAENARWNLRSIQEIQRCSQRNGPCAKFRYYYDGEDFKGLPLGEATKGNVTRLSVLTSLTEEKWLDLTTRKFDEYGNLLERRGPTGQRRTIEWDDVYQLFAVKETVHVGAKAFTSSVEWDYGLNAIKRSTDVNGYVVYYSYDNFGRLLGSFQPGDQDDKPSVEYTYILKAPISQVITRKRSIQNGEFDREQIACFDGLGRTISTLHKLARDRYMVFSHRALSRTGAVTTSWNVYENKGECTFEPPTDKQVRPTTFLYDAMQRMLQKTFPDGSMEKVEYKPFITVSYDQEDTRKDSPHYNTPNTQILDGLGRLVEEIRMPSLQQKLVTKYTYQSVNAKMDHQLETVTYPDGSVKKHEYNLLGHVVKIIDPDRSTVEYQYDANGDLLERKDARGKITVFTYDEISRVLTMQEKGNDATKLTYTYDEVVPEFPEAKNMKGRLSRLVYPHGVMTTSYDVSGTPLENRHTYMGITFVTKNAYNLVGDLLETTWPDGRKVSYTYDSMGRLTSMPGFVDSFSYSEHNQLVRRVMANRTEVTLEYNNMQWLKSINWTTKPGFQLSFDYDATANITSIKEVHQKDSTHTYSYDALYRLTRASLHGGQEVLTYEQDGLHNMTSRMSSLGDKSPVHWGKYTYHPTKIHAATQIGNVALGYDDAGNVKTCGDMEHDWDFMSRMTQTRQKGATVGRYWYGEAAYRIAKEEQQLQSFYPFTNFRIYPGYIAIYVQHRGRYIAEWRSTAWLSKFYDDLAPAQGEDTLTAQPDGKITTGDAWLYHAARQNIIKISTQPRSMDINLTRNMLQASLYRMLEGEKEQKYYLHTDHLGSIRLVTNEEGNVVQYNRYYPYGAIESQEGNIVPLDYQGTERDQATGLNYFGARYLHTRLAKWLSPDPMFTKSTGNRDETNSYSPVSNNPINHRDLGGYLSSDTVSDYLSAGVAITGVLIFGGMFTVRALGEFRIHGRKMNATHGFLAVAGYANAALLGTAFALSQTGNQEAAFAMAATVGVVATLRSIGVAYLTHRQHLSIKNYAFERYSKQSHKIAMRARIASTFMSGAATSIGLLSEQVNTTVNGVPVGLIVAGALAVGAGIANHIAVRSTAAYGMAAGGTIKFLGITLYRASGTPYSGKLLGQSAYTNKRDAILFARNQAGKAALPVQMSSQATQGLHTATQRRNRKDKLLQILRRRRRKK